MSLVLGGFIFTDYAIPERVVQGGEHTLVLHKTIGGTRVIDAMGPDDSDITWSGRFQGVGALNKTMALDQLRKSGKQIPLVVDSAFYTVVVKKFEYDYERSYQILYKITVMIVTSSGGGFVPQLSINNIIAVDMAAAGALVTGFSAAVR